MRLLNYISHWAVAGNNEVKSVYPPYKKNHTDV